MRPLNRYERFLMRLEMKLCKHDYLPIEMPSGWGHMSGSLICYKCHYSIPVEVNIVSDDE